MALRSRLLAVAFVSSWAALPLEAGTPRADPSCAHLGTNLAGISDWSTQWPFVDAFRISRSWIPQRPGYPWGQGWPLATTPEGWVASLDPGQWAETVMLDNGAAYPAGTYVVLYDGQGTITFMGATVASQSPGRIELSVTPSESGIWLRLMATNAADPVRNIRVILPGFEPTYATQPFHPLFLARMRPYSVLRFMDWMQTNNSPVREWADRTLLSHSTQSRASGVAYELLIDLANATGKDAWFNIPHEASDDLVQRLATLIRDRLAPDLRIYVEYSNETWNGIFDQAQYVQQQGLALGLSTNAFQAGLFYHSRRAGEIFAIFESVLGPGRPLVRVLAAQAANPWTGQQVVEWNNAYLRADAIAIAPYFCGHAGTPDQAPTVVQMNPAQLLAYCQAHVSGDVRQWIQSYQALAQQRGLALVAYEGGQHLVGVLGWENNQTLTDLFIATNRDPGMATLYGTYFDQWRDLGAGVFMHFSDVTRPSKWGSWGALEYQNQPLAQAPKLQALRDWQREGGYCGEMIFADGFGGE